MKLNLDSISTAKWRLGTMISVLGFCIFWTWRVAETKHSFDVQFMESRHEFAKNVDDKDNLSKERHAHSLTQISALKRENELMGKRIEKAEETQRVIQQLILSIEGMKSDIKYQSKAIDDLKDHLKEQRGLQK